VFDDEFSETVKEVDVAADTCTPVGNPGAVAFAGALKASVQPAIASRVANAAASRRTSTLLTGNLSRRKS
jgi:hypothetical protein